MSKDPRLASRRTIDRKRAQRGMTLLEMLVVLGIVALMASLVGPRVLTYLSRAKAQTAEMQLRNVASALELYFVDTGRFPPESVGLVALVTAPPGEPYWQGPYLKSHDALLDPWGRPYGYRVPGTKGEFDLFSLGRDGAPGGEGEDADFSH